MRQSGSRRLFRSVGDRDSSSLLRLGRSDLCGRRLELIGQHLRRRWRQSAHLCRELERRSGERGRGRIEHRGRSGNERVGRRRNLVLVGPRRGVAWRLRPRRVYGGRGAEVELRRVQRKPLRERSLLLRHRVGQPVRLADENLLRRRSVRPGGLIEQHSEQHGRRRRRRRRPGGRLADYRDHERPRQSRRRQRRVVRGPQYNRLANRLEGSRPSPPAQVRRCECRRTYR